LNNHENKHKWIEHTNGLSLSEVNGTVKVPKGKSFFRTLLAYSGPGALVMTLGGINCTIATANKENTPIK